MKVQFPLSRLLLLLALFTFSLTFTGYSVVSACPPGDSCVLTAACIPDDSPDGLNCTYTIGTEDAARAGLLTSINQSQTIAPHQVTVQWAYMDERQVVVKLFIETTWFQGIRQIQGNVSLRDAYGTVFGCCHQRSSSGDRSIPTLAHGSEYTFTVPKDYLAQFDEPPLAIPLILELNAGGNPLPVPSSVIPAATSVAVPSPEATDEAAPDPDVFRFEFSVPVYPAVTVEANQTVTAADGEAVVTLQALVITPINTWVRLCYRLPNEHSWVNGSVDASIQGRLPSTMLLESWINLDAEGCQEYAYDTYYDGRGGTYEMTIGYLHEYEPRLLPRTNEGWTNLLPQLEAHGITVELTPEGALKSLSTPGNDALFEAMRDLNIWQRVEGPFSFTVELPAVTWQ